jgi:hypothetical protein
MLLLEDKSKERFDDFVNEIIKQMAIIFQVPLDLLTKTYEKDNQSKI